MSGYRACASVVKCRQHILSTPSKSRRTAERSAEIFANDLLHKLRSKCGKKHLSRSHHPDIEFPVRRSCPKSTQRGKAPRGKGLLEILYGIRLSRHSFGLVRNLCNQTQHCSSEYASTYDSWVEFVWHERAFIRTCFLCFMACYMSDEINKPQLIQASL